MSSARPIVDGRAVYVLADHTVRAVDKATGVLLWTAALAYPADVDVTDLGYGMAIAAGHLVVADIDVFGLDPATGAVDWRFAPRTQFPGERAFQRISTDGINVYVGGVRGNVYAVDGATGQQRWFARTTTLDDVGIRVFNPVVDDGAVFVSFSDDHASGGLSAATQIGAASIDAATGAVRWSILFPKQQVPTPNEPQGVVLAATRVLTVTANGTIIALDKSTGIAVDSVQSTEIGFPTTPAAPSTEFVLAANDSIVIVGSWTGELVGLDASDLHRRLWASPVYNGAVWDLVIDSSRVYSTYGGGQFLVSDLATGVPVWWIDPYEFRADRESILFAPALDTDRVFVGADRDVFAFERK